MSISEEYQEELNRIHKTGTLFARRMAYISGAIFVTLSLMLAWSLYDRFEQTNEARRENKAVWHAVICNIEQSVIANGKTPLSDKVVFIRFYDGLLVNDVHTRGCGITVDGSGHS